MPLSLAGLDREVRDVRHHKIDVEEGLLPEQQRLRGLLRALEGRAFYGRSWSGRSVDNFMDAMDSYIHWYNEQRIKASLGGMSPLQV